MRVGVDLLDIERFRRVAEHRRYRTVLFTAAELADADRLAPGRAVERLAGRFCAKEAIAKLLGRGFCQGLVWRDIEVTSDEWGAPRVTLRRGALDVAAARGFAGVDVSLSHQAHLVVAVATPAEPSSPAADRTVEQGSGR